jgi:hypothetical protein
MTDENVAPNSPIDGPAPLVDEALAATGRNAGNQEELRALRSDVARLKNLLHAAVSGAGRLGMEEFRGKLRAQPITAAAAVGVLAFLYGVTR